MQPAPAEDELAVGPPPAAAATCPVAHGSPSAARCPVGPQPGGAGRSRADLVVRRLLLIRERPTIPTASTASAATSASGSAYGSFQRSMLISAVRCTLTYVVFPFVAPAVGFATGVGPVVGLVIGSFAIVCDVFTIRRFFAVDHRFRWPVSIVAFCVICLLAVLLVQDVSHLLR